MIGHHFQIAIEKPLSNAKNINAGQQNDRQTDAEDDAQGEDRVAVLVDDDDKHRT